MSRLAPPGFSLLESAQPFPQHSVSRDSAGTCIKNKRPCPLVLEVTAALLDEAAQRVVIRILPILAGVALGALTHAE